MPHIVHTAIKVDDLEGQPSFMRMSSAFTKLAQDMPRRRLADDQITLEDLAAESARRSRQCNASSSVLASIRSRVVKPSLKRP